MDNLGGFGGLFDLAATGYQDPLLVAATDGVGTKLRIAIDCQQFQAVGIDLVAMCVNDLVVQGAEPLFFLDYYATGKLEPPVATDVIAGIADGCRQAGCALIGGETAEMPGMYQAGDFDLAGFTVGAVERSAVLTGSAIAGGNKILGLTSSGIHSNGFSLVRHILEKQGVSYDQATPFPSEAKNLGTALLTPTRIYVRACLDAIAQGGVTGLAHITGGGMAENLSRILPKSLGAALTAWPIPPIFRWLAAAGAVAPPEMMRTFNCGIGMVVVVEASAAATVADRLRKAGETCIELGTIVPRSPDQAAVTVDGWESAW